MTVLTRWEPFRELHALQSRMSRLFEQQYGGRDEALTAGAFVPAVDIYEDEHGIQLKLEVPGVEEKDLDIKSRTTSSPSAASASSRRKRKKRTSTASSAAMAASPVRSPCPARLTPKRSQPTTTAAC